MSTNAFNGLQNLQLSGPISITERIASGQPVTPIVDFNPKVAEFNLRGNDNLHPQKDLNKVISAISNGIQPSPTRTLIQQLVPVDPFTPNSFPKPNDFLKKTDQFIQQVLSPNFGANFSAPINLIQTTPFGLPIPDVGNNAEPLRLFALGTGFPFSTINNVQPFNGVSVPVNQLNTLPRSILSAPSLSAASFTGNTPTMLQTNVSNFNNTAFVPNTFGMDLASLNLPQQQPVLQAFSSLQQASPQAPSLNQALLETLGTLAQNLNTLIAGMIQRPNTFSSLGSQLLPSIDNNPPAMTVFRIPLSQNS
jgi:hypothetical protein